MNRDVPASIVTDYLTRIVPDSWSVKIEFNWYKDRYQIDLRAGNALVFVEELPSGDWDALFRKAADSYTKPVPWREAIHPIGQTTLTAIAANAIRRLDCEQDLVSRELQ